MKRINPIETNDESESYRKRKESRKQELINDDSEMVDAADISIAAAAAFQIQQQSGDISKLNIDCLEELFDYLALDDLMAIGQTCKRLIQVLDYMLHRNYAAATIICTHSRIIINLTTVLEPFYQFIDRMRVFNVDLRSFARMNFQSNFRCIRRIELLNIYLWAKTELKSFKLKMIY